MASINTRKTERNLLEVTHQDDLSPLLPRTGKKCSSLSGDLLPENFFDWSPRVIWLVTNRNYDGIRSGTVNKAPGATLTVDVGCHTAWG